MKGCLGMLVFAFFVYPLMVVYYKLHKQLEKLKAEIIVPCEKVSR